MLNRMKTSAADKFNRIKDLSIAAKLTLLLMTVVTAVIFALVFRDIISYELGHAYNWDSPLYWSVGRGMLNGLKPYIDMYENKPVGVFLISALSFALTDDTIVCNIVSILAVLSIAILPALIVIDNIRYADHTEKSDSVVIRNAVCYVLILLMGLMIAVFSELRSGGFQAESIGAAFSLLYIFLINKMKNIKTLPKRIILTAAAALSLSCAVMLKEPFLLVSVFGALLFVDNFKDFLKNILLTCAAGGVIFTVILAAIGVLVPYFTVYIRRMFETRVSSSSLFSRGVNVFKLFQDIWEFSGLLCILLLAFILLSILRAFINRKSFARFAVEIVKFAAAILTASFCVGLGGQYFNHHYIFAVPIYCAFIVYGGSLLFEFQPEKYVMTAAAALFTIAAVILSVTNIGISYQYSDTEAFDTLKAKAEYVDSLLDYYGAERYQFIGFNEDEEFFGLTKHSPQGPVFVQDPVNFISKNTWFYQRFAEQLDECDVIIFNYYSAPGTRELMEEAVDTSFTDAPAREYDIAPPDGFDCQIYYRTSKFG